MHFDQTNLSDSCLQLHELLDANLLLPQEYQGRFTNHLPMSLHALHSLGASPDRLHEFFIFYGRRFQNKKHANAMQTSPLPTENWLRLRGQENTFPSLLAYFNGIVASHGMEGALRFALPDLMPGVAAAAFHGVIRTAHAFQAAHAGELAAALSYWACRWQHLMEPPVAHPMIGFDNWARLLVAQDPGRYNDGELISTRMSEASRSNAYLGLAGALLPAASLEVRIAELAKLAVNCYVARPSFTTLHLVTGFRALRTLLPWIQDSETSQATVVNCFVAAFIVARGSTTDIEPVVVPKPQSWAEVIKAAISSNDEHVVKLVHACRDEAQWYGERLYLTAATQATIT